MMRRRGKWLEGFGLFWKNRRCNPSHSTGQGNRHRKMSRDVRDTSLALVTTLDVVDFDGTLVWTPGPEDGRNLYQSCTGVPFPWSGWWGRPESLRPPLVPSPAPRDMLNDELAQRLRASWKDPTHFSIVLTGRVEKLRADVERILTDLDMGFLCGEDRLFMKRGSDDVLRFKSNLLLSLVLGDVAALNLSGVKKLVLWDDRIDQVRGFDELLRPRLEARGIDVDFYHVSKETGCTPFPPRTDETPVGARSGSLGSSIER
ncbi:hypothetical protein FVE85_6997 [Porphyridium purpureum]|uniref:Swiss Army Knife RNA repair protein HAD domain-containing protein n=1 Tax=Porphyridium purpureum TaxID=35688 RepID=A0A5J4YT13_PORPP|nr:hypothetical protein FVE85_3869 [Porphyridium purpureum]KAA8499412.1 hypothetical protein FVE85_6997 [Porphyridium purpureum]|eukprot:POR7645..scf295_1